MAFKSLVFKNIKHFSSEQPLQVTALNNYHKTVLNAKMVPFCGYEMPVQYKPGGKAEHEHCRENASIFDVSHMGQVKIYGKDRNDFIMRLSTGHIDKVQENNGYLSLLLNEKAGIIDDCIITKFSDHLNLVVNAGNKKRDLEHFAQVQQNEFAGKDITIEYLPELSLLALQGPKARQLLQQYVPVDLQKFALFSHQHTRIEKLNADIQLCSCGYTGEDGFEISIANDKIEALCDLLLGNPEILPAGLAARDSLRLEAGLCLHGNDMDEQTNPAEATLMWLVRKPKDYPIRHIGRPALTASRKEGITKKRIGYKLDGKGVIREGSEIQTEAGEKIGSVCSGTFGPSVKVSIGMAYVKPENANIGDKLVAVQKGRKFPITVSKAPFIETKYFKPV